jgi:alkylhydroperoxidase family enzyme
MSRRRQPPRLQPVSEPPPEVAEILGTMPMVDGRQLNVFATLAHHPRMLKRLNVFGGLFLAHSTIALRDREIVILRAAWRAGCEYEFGQHTLLGRQAGLSDTEIAGLAGAQYRWPDADQTLIDLADQVHAAARLEDPTWEAVHAAHGDLGSIELIMLAGFYRMLAGFLNTLRVELDPGVPGWP